MPDAGPNFPIARRAIRIAFGVYRRHPLAVAGVAAVVFAPLALLDSFVATEAEDLVTRGGGRAVAGVVLYLGTALLTAGSAVGAGLMHRMVAVDFGGARMTMREALRSLPKRRILALDLVVSLFVATGGALGALPGLIVYTLLCLAAPFLVEQDLGVRAALARSVGVTRQHVLVAFLVVTLPVAVEHALLDALEIFWDFPFSVLFVAHLVMAVTVLAWVVLVEISLALVLAEPGGDAERARSALEVGA
ncbi:MAG TPA: hypothetical protein VH986_13290 [Acidimicrobiia bacterium]